jgi:hypothetical protein
MFSKLAALSLLPLAFAAPAPEAKTKYIVVMKPGASTASVTPSIEGVTATHSYNIGAFQGFAADLTSAHVDTLKSHPNVSLHSYSPLDLVDRNRSHMLRLTARHTSLALNPAHHGALLASLTKSLAQLTMSTMILLALVPAPISLTPVLP